MNISVVIPARNAGLTIRRALDSILISEEVSEIIVVNDGSSDGTGRVVKSYSDSRIRMIDGPSRGIAAAVNAGFNECSEDFISRCDADDWIEAGRFSWQLDAFQRMPELVAVSAGFSSASPDGAHIADLSLDGIEREVTVELLRGQAVTTLCSWLIRKDAIREVGGLREWFSTAEDLDLMFRLASLGAILHIPQRAYWYCLHSASITHHQGTAKRKFFEEAATKFALQRSMTDCDDLDAGRPPSIPSDDFVTETVNSQIVGHLVGQAWSLYGERRRCMAIYSLLRAIRYQPKMVHSFLYQIVVIIIKRRR